MTLHGIQINGWKFDEQLTAATPSAGYFTPAGTGTSESVAPAPGSGGSLSNSAKVGIGVGVSLGAIGLVALGAGLLMIYRSRRTARSLAPSTDPLGKDLGDGTGSMSMSSAQVSQYYVPELQVPNTEPRSETPPHQHPPSIGQGWGGYSADQQAAYAAYGTAAPHPHSEVEATSAPRTDDRMHRRVELEGEYDRIVKVEMGAMAPAVDDRTRRRMELEGEFERNVKVLWHPPR